MIFSTAFAAVLTAAGFFIQDAIAHSVKRNPLSAIARIEDAVIKTPSHRVHALSSFDVSFVLSDTQQRVRLSLEPNHDLISEDATIQYLRADGTVHKVEPVNRQEHRVFKGESFVQREEGSEWKHVGWARINVHRDGDRPIFDGVFTIDGNHHHVQTKTAYRQTAVTGDPELDEAEDDYMVVWRDTDIRPSDRDELKRDLAGAATCGSDNLLYNRDENNIVYRSLDEAVADTASGQVSPRVIFGRQIDSTSGSNGAGVNLANSIGSTAGCPNTRKVALVGIATDCTYTKALGSNQNVTSNVLQFVNAASQLYESTFNISLALQNLTISEPECPSTPPSSAPWNQPCSDSVAIENRLSLFSQWRGQWTDTNAYWTLMSTCNTGPAVGLAWLGAVCQQGAQTRDNETSASANVVVRTSSEWLVFAHETGHIFGAVHDCTSQTCSDGTVTRQECCPLSTSTCDANSQFIMNPSTGNGITKFSPCSIGNICSFLGRSANHGSCLTSNRALTTFTSQCGNGIVEDGEDCDCGGETGCANNTCCDPKTCKYTQGSVCDPTNDECCTAQCGFMAQGTVCRASTGPCDPQEVCTGTSAGCPADQIAPDGQACGNSGDGLACASGRCTSRDQQCQTFMGANATTSCSSSGCMLSCHSSQLGPDQCYVLNQYFLDGTPCEGGGKCSNGNCQGSSLWRQILDWINDNKQISIPIFCVVGGLLLLSILCCCWSCVSRLRRRRGRGLASRRGLSKASAAAAAPGGWAADYFGARRAARGSGTPPGMRPGPSYSPVPPPPEGTQQDMRWEPLRSTSFRYA
ncbi:d59725a9-c928-4d42-a0b7-affcde029f47 [Thermothielavioides terrestris]|uniref:Disintegrin and metalloproteinase domain-containing protein B n=2 Tax=Thermothielavioides terrestris TaxID=2587410 RepID=G2RI47_THETT|nr:uncharacterized protein THITE_2123961 [Thermothielavioides terrestris NRRL 8126]AEO71509.1 hypothetical protein THITE_2123961 [Thermothielavioides terrestris NRRL 8126]SPQ27512.1 d59725a9-c928-4d42-a0b7-affcde029f47 [Thermothielavioides terrestris]